MRKELFLDDRQIEAMAGLSRTFHHPVAHPGNPVVTAEHPWEGCNISPSTAVYDPTIDRFRVWYQVYYTHAHALATHAIDDVLLRDIGFRYGVGYMESADGVHFEKPLLGRVRFNDADTNLAIRGYFSPSPQTCIFNPDEPVPQKRYRLWVWDEAPQGPQRHSLIGMSQYVSTDGYDWRGFEWNDDASADPQPFCYVKQVGQYRYPYSIGPNECNGIYWDPTIQRFVNYCRAWNGSVRSLGRMESPDGIHWSQPTLVAAPDLQDPFLFQFYQAKAYRSGEFVILYVMTYAPAQDHRCEVQILASRDGAHFDRVGDRHAWIATGESGSWNAGMVSAAAPVLHKDRLWIYAMGSPWPHNAQDPDSAIGLFHLRPDGYVSLDATDAVGSFTTRPMVWTHESIRVNVESSRGEVAVEVLDAQRARRFPDHPVSFFDHYPAGMSGFGQTDCVAFSGDSLEADLRFRQRSLAELKGHYVQLRFYLRNARLYSWSVA